MFIFQQLNYPRSALAKAVQYLKEHICQKKLYRSAKVVKFVFLCGGNQENGEISERRKAILRFVEKTLPNIRIFIAEAVFDVLMKEGHKENVLDIEEELTKFADEIIILLESNSAFCELGAFSSKSLRKKIIVINDEKYKNKDSFINIGPIKAIKEKAGDKKIIYYKMTEASTSRVDSIGDTFFNLEETLKSISPVHPEIITLDICNPNKSFEKDTVRFIHDLIFFTGPIMYRELIKIMEILYGDNDYSRLRECLGLLTALNLISLKEPSDRKGCYYFSKVSKTLLDYRFDTNIIIASFRNAYQRYDLSRLSYAKN